MGLLVLSSGGLKPSVKNIAKVKCSTHVLHVCTLIKLTLSQQDVSSALQKTLKFEFPLRAAAEATKSQAWLIPKIDCDKLKYP
jgi:hypothetical protein